MVRYVKDKIRRFTERIKGIPGFAETRDSIWRETPYVVEIVVDANAYEIIPELGNG